MNIPRGIALVRVETPMGPIVVVSERLSRDEEQAARLIAAARILTGSRAVVLGVLEVAAVISAAA